MTYYAVEYDNFENEVIVDLFPTKQQAARHIEWLWWHDICRTTEYIVRK